MRRRFQNCDAITKLSARGEWRVSYMSRMYQIRYEGPGDVDRVRELITMAFGGPDEARLVDAIRAPALDQILSLVATENESVVGHIMFSPVRIEGESGLIATGMGLAPLAVHPSFQQRGIGSALVREGLHRLDELHCPFVVVVGHPTFYPRFGFVPASRFAVRSQFKEIPDDVFMIRRLPGATFELYKGTAYYLPAFTDPSNTPGT